MQAQFRQLSLEMTPSLPQTPKSSNWPRRFSNGTQFSGTMEEPDSLDNGMDDYLDPIHLYMPLGLKPGPARDQSPEDLENFVGVRNLFAFLTGQTIVGTPKQPMPFSIFNNIAGLLRHYEFTNLDSSTLGEIPTTNFLKYIEELGLDDIRTSREKTMEAIILGERMQSWKLYNEGYVHGVGKWDDLIEMRSPIFPFISNTTRKRMEKSSMDLTNRLKNMETRLQDFDFPSLFAGVANSNTNNRAVDFKAWKAAFLAMRRQTMTFYRYRYGAWPPKAKSKKNDFEESGLNRILLQEVYHDLSALYDMLVDRSALTSRSADPPAHDETLAADQHMHNLRRLLSEFDRSTPPVQPPIPYDLPHLPALLSTRRDFDKLSEKKQIKENTTKLSDNEINLALMQSYNRDSVKVTPFLESFMAFERISAHGKSMHDLEELRTGQWIFLYVVLQSLPMVVVDAPGLQWTAGVEYFLCEVPKGSPPWSRDDASQRTGLYRIAGSSGVVSLPADVVDHGVEGIYRRSHCWQAAARWSGRDELDLLPATTQHPGRHSSLTSSTLDSPSDTAFSHDSYHEASSPNTNFSRGGGGGGGAPDFGPTMPPPLLPPPALGDTLHPRNSLALGLTPLAVPQGFVAGGLLTGGRKVSTPDPNKSFEDILGPSVPASGKKKRWEK